MIHICTTDSLLAGGIMIKATCPVCTRKAENKAHYIGMKCSVCGALTDMSESWPDIVVKRRERLKLTRRQMAEATGYRPSSIKRYEFVRCTRPYIAATQKLMRKTFKQP